MKIKICVECAVLKAHNKDFQCEYCDKPKPKEYESDEATDILNQLFNFK